MSIRGKKPKIGNNVFIAPTATVVGDVEIKDGASIWYGAVLRGDMAKITVGKNANIQDNCTVHTDFEKPAMIGDNVTIGHNAVIHGCTIKNNSLIGINATILNNACVKKGCVVAAGSVIKKGHEVGPYHLMVGIPATIKKKMTEATAEEHEKIAKIYVNLAREHMAINRGDD